MQNALDFLLVLVHLVGRGAFLCDKNSQRKGTVADRQKRFRNDVEEISGPRKADNPGGQGDPAMPKKEPQGAPVKRQHSLLDSANDALHPGLLGVFTALRQKA